MSDKTRGRQENEISDDAVDERQDRDASDTSMLPAERLTLGELTEAARVSVRTVRYYIAEGLLPPPEGAGPRSAYTQAHLDRLRLIQRLKDAYLPLKEIRRRLAGLGDHDVRRMLADMDQHESVFPAPMSEIPYDDSLADARNYLALMDPRERYRTAPMSLDVPTGPDPFVAQSAPPSSPEPSQGRGPQVARIARARKRDEHDEVIQSQVPGLWRRIPLGEEAELVISDRIYNRHHERIDWLVRWARKVFG